MKIEIIGAGLITLLIGTACNEEGKHDMKDIAPVAKEINKELTIHGHSRVDPYYWLNERENPEVISYLKAENEYTAKTLKHTEELQENLFEEMKGRIKQTDMSVPFSMNGYFYYTRYEEGKEYPIYCRKKGSLEEEEQIMLEVNEMASGFEYYNVGGWSVSPNNRYLAFGVDTVSRRKYSIYVKDLETGEVFKESMQNTNGSPVWGNDNQTIFYATKDETLRDHKVFRHKMGSDISSDQEVFHEKDNTFSVYVYKTRSDSYIIIGSYSTLSNEYQILDANQTDANFKLFSPRERGLEYSIDHFKDHFYITTNLKAKNFKVMKTPVTNTEKENWKDFIPHREDVLLEGMDVFERYFVLEERKNGLTQLRIENWEDGKVHYLPFEEETYMAYVSTNREYNTDVLRFGYTSLTTPNSIFDYNMSDGSRVLLKQQEVLGDFDKDNYHAERIFATANDGAQVPISLVYKKGTPLDGTSPLLLYGYGSYGNSLDPYFSSVRLSLLDRGFIYAIAHIRGGQEMGRDWYEDGKLLKKKNTFTDFINCGEHLVKEKYAAKDQLYAMGGSAGGLLMGAVVNMKPELFAGVVASVPFVDVITTMLDESIPLTTGEYDEWGNPNDKEYYDYILSYSPYDNVARQDYPPLLVTTGLHDSQVQYWEPAKWVAKLRTHKTDDNWLLLHTNMDTGHGGASGRFERLREIALDYAFLLDLAKN